MRGKRFSPLDASIECMNHTTPIRMIYIGMEKRSSGLVYKFECSILTKGEKCGNKTEIMEKDGKITIPTESIIYNF